MLSSQTASGGTRGGPIWTRQLGGIGGAALSLPDAPKSSILKSSYGRPTMPSFNTVNEIVGADHRAAPISDSSKLTPSRLQFFTRSSFAVATAPSPQKEKSSLPSIDSNFDHYKAIKSSVGQGGGENGRSVTSSASAIGQQRQHADKQSKAGGAFVGGRSKQQLEQPAATTRTMVVDNETVAAQRVTETKVIDAKHARFGGTVAKEPVKKEERSRVLTMKYGKQQMMLIRKRMRVETWLDEQLSELFKSDNGIDVDVDEVLDLESVPERRRMIFDILQKHNCPATMTRIHAFLDDFMGQLDTL